MESVSRSKSGWLAGVALLAVAVAYFALLGTSDFPEPGANITYDLAEFEELDKVPAIYGEASSIDLNVDKPRALATAGGMLYIGAENAVVLLDGNGAETARHLIEGTPTCLAVAKDGTVYVGLRNRVLVLDDSGETTAEWDAFTERSFLTSIVVHDEDVFVADAGNCVVLRFNGEGALLTRIGEKDEANDIPGLEVPSGYLDIAVNPEGHLWVVNPGELGLERYRSDGSIVTGWYRPSLALDGFPGCCNPTHIAFDAEGRLITSEKGLVRVKRFEVTLGEFEGLVAGSKAFPGELSLRDLVVDGQNRVLVLEAERDVVRVFTRKEEGHETARQSG